MTQRDRTGVEPSGQIPDEDLVRRARAGDEVAFSILYRRYAPQLHRYCRAHLRDAEETADVLQESFLLASRNLHQLAHPGRARAWLYAIVSRQMYQAARSRKPEVAEATLPEGADPAAGPEALRIGAERLDVVLAATDGLEPEDRLVIRLYLQGLEGHRLAEACDSAPAQTYVRLHRARNRLGTSLSALLVVRHGRRDCDRLEALLDDWDGTFSPLLRKRVVRHISDCPNCERQRRRLMSPQALLGAVALLGTSTAVRRTIVDGMTSPDAAGRAPVAEPGRDPLRTAQLDRVRLHAGAPAGPTFPGMAVPIAAVSGVTARRAARRGGSVPWYAAALPVVLIAAGGLVIRAGLDPGPSGQQTATSSGTTAPETGAATSGPQTTAPTPGPDPTRPGPSASASPQSASAFPKPRRTAVRPSRAPVVPSAPEPTELTGSPRCLASTPGIMATGGAVVMSASAPKSVRNGQWTSDTEIRLFSERASVPATRPIAVDITRPGRYLEDRRLTRGTLPPGQCLASYYLHFDRASDGGRPITLTGTATFGSAVLGVITSTGNHDATDDLGSRSTAYPDGTGRAMEFAPRQPVGQDVVELSPDRRTVSVTMTPNGGVDSIRVFAVSS